MVFLFFFFLNPFFLPLVSGTSVRRSKSEFLCSKFSAMCFGVIDAGCHYSQAWFILLRDSHTEILMHTGAKR